MHPYQQSRSQIARLMLQLKEIMETEGPARVVTMRLEWLTQSILQGKSIYSEVSIKNQ